MRAILVAAILVTCLGCGEQPETDPTSKTKPDASASVPQSSRGTVPCLRGPEDPSGLQLGVLKDPDTPVIWFVIRNRGKESVRYSDYLLGNVSVLYRFTDGSEWSESPMPYAWSAGASLSNLQTIEPGESMPTTEEWNKEWHPKGATPPEKYSGWVRLPVHLPKEDDRGRDVEIAIKQPLGGDGSQGTWEGTLVSAAMTVSGACLYKPSEGS